MKDRAKHLNMPKIMVSIFLTMKTTIFDTRSSTKNDYNVPYVQLLNQMLYKEGSVGLLVQGLVKLITFVKITNTL